MPGEERKIGGLVGVFDARVHEFPNLAAVAGDKEGRSIHIDGRHLTVARRPDPTLLLDLEIGRGQRITRDNPLPDTGEHLQVMTRDQRANRRIVVCGQAEDDRFVIQAFALVEIEEGS